MSEPLSTTLAAVGVKFTTIVAGFFGGMVSLAFARGQSKKQAAISVAVGTITATFLTPMVAEHFDMRQSELQSGTAFLLGLFAMSAIPAIKLIASKKWGGGNTTDGGVA